MRVATVCICLMVFSLAAQKTPAQMKVKTALNNQDVASMVKARFPDSTILKLILANDTDFDLSVPAMVKLKTAGVSQVVIEAMLSAGANRNAASTIPAPAVRLSPTALPAKADPPAPPKPDLPDEIGVYVREKDKLVEMEPEIVNWRTGGVIKYVATLGIDRGHINGTVNKSHSKLDLTVSTNGWLEFYIRCPEGDSASEYQLLHLWDKGNRREFRTVTGGVFHESGGAQDNVLDFAFEKMASRTYRTRVSLPAGEYGFLTPGTTASANAASQGKIYTFRIVE